MTILRSGTNQAYSDNWAKAFGAKGGKSATAVAVAAKPPKKRTAKKKGGKAKSSKR